MKNLTIPKAPSLARGLRPQAVGERQPAATLPPALRATSPASEEAFG